MSIRGLIVRKATASHRLVRLVPPVPRRVFSSTHPAVVKNLLDDSLFAVVEITVVGSAPGAYRDGLHLGLTE